MLERDDATALSLAALAALEHRGLSAADALECGLRSDEHGHLLIPVRDEQGNSWSTRCYAGPESGARVLDDVGLTGAPLSGTVGMCEGRVFDSTSHVARARRVGKANGTHEGAVFLVDDEISAEIVARRVGATAVAPASDATVEEAAALAARIAGVGPVVLALGRTKAREDDPDAGRCHSRAALAVQAAGGVPRLLGLNMGESVETLIAKKMPLRTTAVVGGEIRLRQPWWMVSPAIAAMGTSARAALAAWKSRTARVAATRVRATHSAPGDQRDGPQRRILHDLAELSAVAQGRGVDLVAIGGLAADLLVGAELRARKDCDVLVLGGSLADMDALAAALEARGYRWLERIPGRMARLERPPEERIELFVVRPSALGWDFAIPAFRASFPRDLATPARRTLGPLEMRALRPDLLLCWKESQLREVESIHARSELSASADLIFDIAVLRRLVGVDRDPLAPVRQDIVRFARPRADVASITRAQLRRLLRRCVPV